MLQKKINATLAIISLTLIFILIYGVFIIRQEYGLIHKNNLILMQLRNEKIIINAEKAKLTSETHLLKK